MKKILVASTNREVIDTVKNACETYSAYFDPDFCPDTDEAISFIDYGLPEIKVLDFTSTDIDCEKVRVAISDDPWLHNGGVIAVVKNAGEVETLEDLKDPNILIIQTLYTFKNNFLRLLRILWSNQHFLFNRGMQERIGGKETGSFVCGNDPMDIRVYTNFLVSYLYYTNRIAADDRFKLQTTLMELLTNALEHGNCNISYADKTACLEQGGNILELIEQRKTQPEIANRKIHIAYEIDREKSLFSIADDGDGFDWRTHMSKGMADETQTHGRGISLSGSLVEELTYNEKGNEVSFKIRNLQNASNSVPGIMQTFEVRTYKNREFVCRENELSNDLFFIVSGRYAVYSNKKLVSVMTPNDMFIGEMAFLLNDRRTATIMSADEGKLIKIPKVVFLNLIRQNPHYGIFLSKLLAQRLVTQTKKNLNLVSELNALKESGSVDDAL